jgi:hypothetical protein
MAKDGETAVSAEVARRRNFRRGPISGRRGVVKIGSFQNDASPVSGSTDSASSPFTAAGMSAFPAAVLGLFGPAAVAVQFQDGRGE